MALRNGSEAVVDITAYPAIFASHSDDVGLAAVFERSGSKGLRRATTMVLFIALVLAFFHHIDHVLRVDHSGWPFREEVTPFTYSLAAYPVIIFALVGPTRLFWLRWAMLAGATLFTLYAHTLIENPADQFHMWAHNESAHYAGVRNALGVRSALVGWLAATVSMALNGVAVLGSLMMLRDGLTSSRPSPS